MELPPDFAARVTGAWPAGGPTFLARLPTLIRLCERRWNLRVLAPFTLSYNYVAPVVLADGSPAVLKLGVPNPELTTEIEALMLYAGNGAARLLEADADLGALLVERVLPGVPLAELDDDDAATSVAASVMQRLWRPLPPAHPFPDLRRWTRSLSRYAARYAETGAQGDGPLRWAIVDKAAKQLEDLLAGPPPPVLIHGDFHHWNVLRAGREAWLAIDPKGVAAEPSFEVGPLLYNPMPGIGARPDLERVTRRRLDLLAEHLGLDRQRMIACAFVAALLSACWSIEDADDGVPGVLRIAGILDKL